LTKLPVNEATSKIIEHESNQQPTEADKDHRLIRVQLGAWWWRSKKAITWLEADKGRKMQA